MRCGSRNERPNVGRFSTLFARFCPKQVLAGARELIEKTAAEAVGRVACRRTPDAPAGRRAAPRCDANRVGGESPMASVAPFVKRFAFSLSSQARSRDLVDVHVSFRYRPQMPNEKLKPAEPSDIAQSIAFALCYSGRKRVQIGDLHGADSGRSDRAAFGAVRLRGHEETAERRRRRQSRQTRGVRGIGGTKVRYDPLRLPLPFVGETIPKPGRLMLRCTNSLRALPATDT